MFRWFNEAGFKADIPGLRRAYPEVHLQTLEEWLRNEGWAGTSGPGRYVLRKSRSSRKSFQS